MYRTAIFMLCLAIVLSNCSPGMEQINFGKDQCRYCKMTISDPKYGAGLITTHGRVYKYDAIECMIRHISDEGVEHQKLFAIAWDQPETLCHVDSLAFVISPAYRSPMGENLAAFDELPATLENQAMTWEAVFLEISGSTSH